MQKKENKRNWVNIFALTFVISAGSSLFGKEALAAPSISGVSGTVSNGSVITVSGNGFGATGPNIVLFDDFESGTNGGNLSDQVRNAQIGTWRDVSGSISPYYPTYSNIQAHSGSLAVRQNWGSGSGTQEGGRWIGATMGGTYNNIYFSFWTYLPVGQNVPGSCSGTGCGIGPNWKVWWLSTNDSFQNDYASEIVTDPPSETSLCWVDGSTNRSCYGYVPFSFTKGRWKRWEVHLVGSTTNGSGQLWLTDSGNTRAQWGSITGRTLDDGTTGWGYLHFPGFGRYDSNSNTYYDDIYVASGSGALARVEIGNASTFSACTNLAIATVTSWSDTSIQATIRQGSFSNGSAYLYVVDSTGAVNANGYLITVGSGSDTTPPTSPTNLAANAMGETSITVSWDPSVDDVGVVRYDIERCPGLSCSTFTQVGTTQNSPYTDSGLTASTGYSYHVRAVDAAGNTSGWSNVVSATTQPSSTPTSCSTITTPTTWNTINHTGYATPYDLFNNNTLIVQADCTQGSPTTLDLSIGNTTDPTLFSLMTGYYWDGSAWQSYTTPTCSGQTAGSWCQGKTTGTITSTSINTSNSTTPQYFLGFTCKYTGSLPWKCGCQDTACTTPSWQLQGAALP